MKNKDTVDKTSITYDQAVTKAKPKSLRPTRSLVAVRSLKPKTAVAAKMNFRTEEVR